MSTNELYLSRGGKIITVLTGGTDEERRRVAARFYREVDMSDTIEGLKYPVSPQLFDLVPVERDYRDVYVGPSDEVISPAELRILGFRGVRDCYGEPGRQCLHCGQIFPPHSISPVYHKGDCPLFHEEAKLCKQ